MIEKVLQLTNLSKARQRIVGNKGSAGVDGKMEVEDLKSYRLGMFYSHLPKARKG